MKKIVYDFCKLEDIELIEFDYGTLKYIYELWISAKKISNECVKKIVDMEKVKGKNLKIG